ncbi:hypothetical protein Sango_2412100 [Sesamum angolense]|uniref:Uncharacterized protein n=1 Tax=Sesamum angolense TaxID=2727404 RepID=A0AAE2BJV2_9LAMI|nr:hypothetical protein Sango_2412100 [Sesamum angolense]
MWSTDILLIEQLLNLNNGCFWTLAKSRPLLEQDRATYAPILLARWDHTTYVYNRVCGGHESCCTVVTGLLADGKIKEHYMRICRWPKLSMHRKQDWGWELSNHLYCYTSVPNTDKEDGTDPFFPLF